MSCKFQCPNCKDVLVLQDKFVAKRIMCPLCDAAQIVPEVDSERVILEHDFKESLLLFKLTAFDCAYAVKAYEFEMVSKEHLRKAIVAIRRLKRKGQKKTINQQLLEKKYIQKSNDLALRQLVKGTDKSAARVKMVECPGCFADIVAKSKSCKYCGQVLGDLLVMDMCPNCKREQATGKKMCHSCGADINTGIKPGLNVPRCPRCGNAVLQNAKRCTRCHTDLSRFKQENEGIKAVKSVIEWFNTNAFNIFFFFALAAGIYVAANWQDVRKKMNAVIEGREKAELKDVVYSLNSALKHNDLEALGKLIAPELKHQVTQATRTIVLGGDHPMKVVKELEILKQLEYKMNLDGGEATVYTETRGTYDPESLQKVVMSQITDFASAAKKLTGKSARILSTTVSWKFKLHKNKWFLVAPLP